MLSTVHPKDPGRATAQPHPQTEGKPHSLFLAPSDFPLQLQNAKVLWSWGARADSPGHRDFRRHEYINTERNYSGKALEKFLTVTKLVPK